MFLVSLSYIAPIEQIEKHLDAHIAFLDRYYDRGVLICSGRKVPRSGGIIIAKSTDRAELETILSEDPFWRENLARYDITEFRATKCAPGLEGLLEPASFA